VSYPPPPYQPQGGNWAAPTYGGPPPKNRAGLIIAAIVVLIVAILGIGGFVAYRTTSGDYNGGSAPGLAPVSTPTRKATPPAPPKTVPTAVPSKVPPIVPSKVPTPPVPSKPVGKGTKAEAFALAGRFVAQLNAGNTEAAAALGCAATRSMIPTLIGIWIKAPTKLTVTDAVIGQDPYIAPISGTTDGKKMGGMVIIQGGCVRVFQLSPS
jgi:hypothetical protein